MTSPLISYAAQKWQHEHGTLQDNAWAENHDAWTPDRYILEFWAITEKRILGDYGGRYYDRDLTDMLNVGMDALIKTANMFHDWCAEKALSANDKLLFWHMLKKRIKWDINHYLMLKVKNPDPHSIDYFAENPELAETVYTQLHVVQHDSIMQGQICDFLAGCLNETELLTLGLVYYDELGVQQIAERAGIVSGTSVSGLRGSAVRKVLAYSLTLTSDVEMPRYSPRASKYAPALVQLVHDMYRMTPTQYIDMTLRAYRIDVSYLVDMLNSANGHYRPTPGSRRLMLDDEQLAEMERLIAEGQSQDAVAKHFGTSQSNVQRWLKMTARQSAIGGF